MEAMQTITSNEQSLIQNSPDWHKFRSTRIGASDVPVILSLSPYKTPLELWEIKVGLAKNEANEFATSRGKNLESVAQEHYEALTGIKTKPTVFTHPNYPFLMASLDGFNAEKGINLEIKCAGKEDHEIATQGKIPEKYYPQVQFQMFVSGAPMTHYWSFDGQEGRLVYAKKDDEYLEEILPKVLEFQRLVETKTEPPLSDKDYKKVNDPKLAKLLERYEYWKVQENEAAIQAEKIREEIKPLLTHRRLCIGEFKIFKSLCKGNIDYDKIPQLKGLDLEPFRKKPYEKMTIKLPKP